MKLRRLVDRYITHRRSLGERCQTNASILRAFCRGLRCGIDLKQVNVGQTTKFLYGKGVVTSAWHVKHNALKGFFRYAISRDYGAKMPLPDIIPQRPPPFVPYIYSREELRRVLQAAKTYQRNCSCMEPETMRIVVLLLYATGLRVREAVALNRADVDLDQLLLTVVKSKFFKSRLVPFSPRLGQVLRGYLSRPAGHGPNASKDTPFFTTERGNRVNQNTVEASFR
jgi:integrase/recombinase XerD